MDRSKCDPTSSGNWGASIAGQGAVLAASQLQEPTSNCDSSVSRRFRIHQGQIRLLSLQFQDEVLHGHLSVWNLDSLPEFSAISYVWGDESPTTELVCDEAGLKITPHLMGALQQLSVSQPDCQHWWVDAICIDQHDPDEKAAQVACIDEVFKRAASVIVWLGPGTYQTDLAMTSASNILRTLAEHKRDQNITEEAWCEAIGLPNKQDPLWKGFEALFSHMWFRRLWTVGLPQYGCFLVVWFTPPRILQLIITVLVILQEALLNEQTVAFCGASSCALSTLLDVRLELDTIVGVRETARSDIYALAYAIRFAMKWPLQLWYVLTLSMGRQTAVAVDHVYGLMGLLRETTRRTIPVDYSEAAKHNYARIWVTAVKLALSDSEIGVRLLEHVPQTEPDATLPSWCANLAGSQQPRIIHQDPDSLPTEAKELSLDQERPHAGHTGDRYEPIDEPARKREPHSDWRVLRRQGVIVDEVTQVVDLLPQEDISSEPATSNRWLRYLAECWEAAPETTTEDEFCRAWLAWPERPPIQTARETTDLELRDLRRAVSGFDANLMRGSTSWAMHERFIAVWWVSKRKIRRVFFVTKMQRFGVGIFGARPGDQVMVMAGADPAFLVRKRAREELWEFRYQAYVHGLMSGQVFDMIECGECAWEEIDLI